MNNGNRSEQRGYALMVSVLIILLITAFGIFMMRRANVSIERSGHEKSKLQTHFAAQGVLNFLAQQFEEEPEKARSHYCPDSAVSIQNLDPSANIIAKGLGTNDLVYRDQVYTYGTLPVEIENRTHIRTAESDRYNSASSFLSFNVDQDADVYVAYDKDATPATWLLSWTATGLTVGTNGGFGFTLYKKEYPAGQKVELGGNLEGTSGTPHMYTVIVDGKGQHRVMAMGQDTVLYRIEGCEGLSYVIQAEGFRGTQSDRQYVTRLARRIGGQNSGDLPVLLFPASLHVRENVYLGRFNDDWAGGPPIFTGDIYSSGDITVDVPIMQGTSKSGEVYFGYDLDNSDGNGEGHNGIRDLPGSPRETAHIYTQSGSLIMGPFTDGSTSDIWVNTESTDAAGHIGYDFQNTSRTDWMVYPSAGASMHQHVADYSQVEDFISYYQLDVLADSSKGGITIKAAATTELWDWNVKKMARVLEIDLSALSVPADFNGMIYIENNSTISDPDSMFAAVMLTGLENLHSPGLFVKMNSLPDSIKGLTIATPNALYTKGSVNIIDSIHLALVSDYHTVLSASWENALSKFDFSNEFPQERSLTLHNQARTSTIPSSPCSTSDPCGAKGLCPSSWGGLGTHPLDTVTNWFFHDAWGNAYRREPRNRKSGCPGDPFCHRDTTRINALIVTGYSLPDAHNPPTSMKCPPPLNDNGCLDSDNTATGKNYEQDQVRLGDALHFLEAWVGRETGEIWEHPLTLGGGLHCLWKSREQGRQWATTLEVNGEQKLELRTPFTLRSDWIQETVPHAQCGTYTYTPQRQVKIGTSGLPTILFLDKATTPPGLGGKLPSSQMVELDYGTWKRDYGDLD